MQCKYCPGTCRAIGETIYQTRYICRRCRAVQWVDREVVVDKGGRTFVCFNHQGKADVLVNSLLTKFIRGQNPKECIDFVLSDNDVGGRRAQFERMKRKGTHTFFVYPHSAPPSMVNDHYSTWEGRTAQFVVNEYHAEVLRGYGYTKPVHGIGWYLCPQRDFMPKRYARNILFAPIHPRNAPIDKKVNAEAFARLYKVAKTGEIDLTVRFVGNLVDNGLQEKPGVNYTNEKMDLSFSQIDNADVVIGHQTIAWLAVARGTPTVMMAEDMPRHFKGSTGVDYKDVKSWNKVKHLFQYPYDILEADDTMSLLNKAAGSSKDITDWRRRMIGEQFNSDKFLKIVEGYL